MSTFIAPYWRCDCCPERRAFRTQEACDTHENTLSVREDDDRPRELAYYLPED